MPKPTVLVTYEASAAARQSINNAIGAAANVVYFVDLPSTERERALSGATALLASNTSKELKTDEAALLRGAQLLQFVASGTDFVPMSDFPPELPIAGNGGAYSEPMAEHAVMMALAACKRLIVEHNNVAKGEFNQFTRNRMLAGSVCGILGFGGIGQETARLMRALGTKVHAINRSGQTEQPVDWIADQSRLDELLEASDILILSLPLTPSTQNLIGTAELQAMKRDAVLINLARGEIIDEAALFTHLEQTPEFTACLDAWWVEPVRHGRFEMSYDFTSLANVIASPHNSASVVGWREVALSRACKNIVRVLNGESPRFLVPPADRMS